MKQGFSLLQETTYRVCCEMGPHSPPFSRRRRNNIVDAPITGASRVLSIGMVPPVPASAVAKTDWHVAIVVRGGDIMCQGLGGGTGRLYLSLTLRVVICPHLNVAFTYLVRRNTLLLLHVHARDHKTSKRS